MRVQICTSEGAFLASVVSVPLHVPTSTAASPKTLIGCGGWFGATTSPTVEDDAPYDPLAHTPRAMTSYKAT